MSRISVKQLVLEYLGSKNEGSDIFVRLFDIARLQGMRKFQMDVTGTFKTVLLPISANHTVPFPSDYLDYSMVGVVNERGEGIPLKHNEDILPIKQAFLSPPNELTKVPTIPGFTEQLNMPGGPLFWLNYQDGYEFYHLYGFGGGSPSIGEFTVDDNARCFLIDRGFCFDSILVEYLTNGFDCDCNTYMIHTFAADAFMAWLRWKDNIDKKGVGYAEKNALRLDWAREKKMARARLNPVRIMECEKVFRQHVKLVARA